ncbi:MAG TPA: hypothetical protein VEQ58_06275, partial [Polyangiaceae bacterium]|nr:hypothetical protein [Polyangiaceae bacterium]
TAAACGNSPALIYEGNQLRAKDLTVQLPPGDLTGTPQLALHEDFYALSLSNDERTRVLAGTRAVPVPGLDACLHGAGRVALRFYGDLLLIADDRGRVLGFDPLRFQPLFNLRL